MVFYHPVSLHAPHSSASNRQNVAAVKSKLKPGGMPPSIAWAKLRAALLGQIFGRFYIDTNHEIGQSVIISSTHRSGSTWLANLVNHQLRYRMIFEPVRHARKRTLKVHRRRYLRPGEKNEALKQSFESLLRGTERGYHLNRRNSRLLCHGRLLKDVSINLFLKWLRLEFPPVPIIYLIRSPFQVVHSCLSVDWLTPREPAFWLGQEALVRAYLRPFTRLIAGTQTTVEKLVLEWCILNFVPLRQFGPNEWKTVTYSALVRRPAPELEGICTYLGIPYRKSVLEQVAVPSHTAERSVQDRERLLQKWKSSLSQSDVDVIERYASEFGLERYLDS